MPSQVRVVTEACIAAKLKIDRKYHGMRGLSPPISWFKIINGPFKQYYATNTVTKPCRLSGADVHSIAGDRIWRFAQRAFQKDPWCGVDHRDQGRNFRKDLLSQIPASEKLSSAHKLTCIRINKRELCSDCRGTQRVHKRYEDQGYFLSRYRYMSDYVLTVSKMMKGVRYRRLFRPSHLNLEGLNYAKYLKFVLRIPLLSRFLVGGASSAQTREYYKCVIQRSI